MKLSPDLHPERGPRGTRGWYFGIKLTVPIAEAVALVAAGWRRLVKGIKALRHQGIKQAP